MGSASVAEPQRDGWRRCLSRWRRDVRGAVYVEFLIAFLPVYTMFLCLIQLGLLFTVRLVVDHAAENAARAAAVVIGDDEEVYDYGEDKHTITPGSDDGRYKVVRNAALLTLAPLIVNGVVQTVDVEFPPSDEPGGDAQSGTLQFAPMDGSTVQKVRVRVVVQALCRIGLANRIACRDRELFFTFTDASGEMLPVRRVRSEAIFPYQGAKYDPPE